THPKLNELKSETRTNQANAENTHKSFGYVIRCPFDEGSEGAGDCSDHTDGESRFQSDCHRVLPLVRGQAADIAGSRVADRAIRCGQQKHPAQTRAGSGSVVEGRPDTQPVSDRLAGRA